MLPVPRQGVAPPSWSVSNDLDDDDGWQDMPVVRSDNFTSDLDAIDDKRYHYRPPEKIDDAGASGSNATGTHLEFEGETAATDSWRQKGDMDESDYTRLRLNEDEESEEVHMRTRYLFDEEKAMTPLSQMQATKELLTEGQRIAYVGVCQLIAARMVKDMGRGWEGSKEKNRLQRQLKGKGRALDVPVVESGKIWLIKIMARLYQHMELAREEQQMIESLAEHGVDPADLVPALMTTHTVKNPEFDPEAKRRAAADATGTLDTVDEEDEKGASEAPADPQADDDPAPPYEEALMSPPHEHEEGAPRTAAAPSRDNSLALRPLPSLHDEDDGDIGSMLAPPRLSPAVEDDGDIGTALSGPSTPPRRSSSSSRGEAAVIPTSEEQGLNGVDEELVESPTKTSQELKVENGEKQEERTPKTEGVQLADQDPQFQPMPALPGVSTTITSADEEVTLDIRWTVLCDLFLVLIADSVYDARSRAYLIRVASALGFDWLDVVRFENRVTEALEIEESVGQLQQGDVITSRQKLSKKSRYAMIGAATLGGGLVIGLSAGLLAPLIGAGIVGALGAIGVSATGGFITGVGGAALITTGGVLTGANIAGRGMARRKREVRLFELKPLHNNKRVSCIVTVGGFMAGKHDDVRLPFSVLDPSVGDVFSVLWEPDMMAETGGALKILGTEVLTQVGQTILQHTLMMGLMGALQWPMILTKLGYLIDNPWLNALDRAKAAGLVLADVLIQRHAGVRPTTLVGFSLGARVIFFALMELARQRAYGIVQDVYLFGATLTATRQQWLDARSVVGGRFCNGFSTNDWMLGYLFRATTGGLQTIAGLRPVETVPGLENVDCTELIYGHMSYRTAMPQLLAHVGFPCTADHFDDLDDPDLDPDQQERYVVQEGEEGGEIKKKKILGIFPRKSGSRAGSGVNTPVRKSGDQPALSPGKEGPDDDLPPREDGTPAADAVPEEADLGDKPSPEAEAEALRRIPKMAGFDFAAISKELGKDLDMEAINRPTSPSAPTPAPPPPERTESAPPLAPPSPSPESRAMSPPARAQSAHLGLAVDDDGDIAITAQKAQALTIEPSWDKWGSTDPTPPPLPRKNTAPSIFGFNAWSAPTGSFTEQGHRAAPPARPHPPELSNPFANGDEESHTFGTGLGVPAPAARPRSPWKEDKMALENPW